MMNIKFYLGCSGFYYNHWRNIFYPEDYSKRKWLEYYAQHFNTVEINSTFYRFPKDSTLKGWVSRTPEGFIFSLKMNKLVTHKKRFNDTLEIIDKFYKSASLLEEKLGCILFQLPPSFHFDMEKLNNIIEQVNPEFKNVIEFRHKSWWNQEVYDKLKENNIAFCSVSAPKLPDDLIITSKITYIRFHGKNNWFRYNYSDKELEEWSHKIKKIVNRINQIYIYFNNDFEGHAIKNCNYLKKIL